MEKTPDYSKTVIYKIIPNNNDLDYCYIGSSSNIEQRNKNHRSNCEKFKSYSYNRLLYKTIRENRGWDKKYMIKNI
jgi:predicted GIY-YIG superfamily endonuclease